MFADCSTSDASNCVYLHTLIEDMCRYSELMNYNNLINIHSIDTSNTLNIFLHLIDKHSNNRNFKFITKKLDRCNITTCSIFKSNYRHRTKSRQDKTMMLSTKVVASCQIMKKIHCFYQHCYDIGNVFIDEDQTAETTVIKMRKIKELMSAKNKPNKNIFNLIQKRNEKYNDLKFYSFGKPFGYGYTNEVYHYNDDFQLMNSKYDNLKTEMIDNKIFQLAPKQFESEYQNAKLHLSTFYCKNNYASINLEHILSLLIYCNFDSLQREFSKTYWENIPQHEEFFHLGKNLKASVQLFGASVTKGSIKSFYHGIGNQLIFPQIIGADNHGVSIHCPLSTSSSFEVAMNFTNYNHGLIVQFGGDESQAKYFPVDWLSNFPNEHEMLFIQNKAALQIINIFNVKECVEYQPMLLVLRIIEAITTGQEHFLSESSQHITAMISHIISNQLSKLYPEQYESFKSLSVYAAQLIDPYFKNKQELILNY
eukprot:52772_1